MGDFNKIWVTHVMWYWQILQHFSEIFSVIVCQLAIRPRSMYVSGKKKPVIKISCHLLALLACSDMWFFFFTIGFLFGWTLISWMNYEFPDWFLRYSKSMTKILYSFIDLWNFTINGLLILLINKYYLTSNNPIYKLINLISSLFKYDFRQNLHLKM